MTPLTGLLNFLPYYDVSMGIDVVARSFSIDAVLFDVNKELSTADADTPNTVLVVNGLVPVMSGGSLIGYALIDQTDADGRTHARLFLDYSTPERLELENGERRYLHAIVRYAIEGGSILADAPVIETRFHISHLEISPKENKAEVAIGEL